MTGINPNKPVFFGKHVTQKEDVYDTYPDHVIVHSKSGNDYFINSKLQCTCKGYGYRETCRHVEHVINQCLLTPPVTAKADGVQTNQVQDDIMSKLIHGSKNG